MTPPLHLLFAVALLLFSSIVISNRAVGDSSTGWVDPRYDAATHAKLKSLVVSVRWEKVDVSQVLRDLEAKSKSADPTHIGLRFRLNLPASTSKLKSHGYPVYRTVSILIENAPLDDVLGYICQQTNLVVRAHVDVVTLTLWNAEDQEAELHAPPTNL